MSLERRIEAERPRRIAVFRALQLGDMLCAVPALRALRRLYPHAHITLIGLPWAVQLRARYAHYLDDFLSFPGFPGLPEREPDIAATLALLRQVQGRFDLAIQLHGSGALTNQILLLLGARRSAGFYAPPGWCPDADSWWPYPADEHEIRRNLRLMQYLGAPCADERLEFPLQPNDHCEAAWQSARAGLGLGPHVCLHAGARCPAKRWAPRLFARVGDALAARGYQVVLTGSAAERDIAAQVAQAMTRPAINLACEISIGGMAAVLARASLVVSNDTGAAHLAVALGVPSVVIFFATDARRWAPLDGTRHRVLADPTGVGATAVVNAALQLLARYD